jgi:hypothetical protein
VPEVTALRGRPFRYDEDDPEVRLRVLDVLTRLSFEAFVWLVRGDTDDRRLAELATGLLKDRLAANRATPLRIQVDPRTEGHVTVVRAAVATAILAIGREQKRTAAAPSVDVAERAEPCIGVADYAAAVVAHRLTTTLPRDVRAFERLHPSKIRVIHELGTRDFFDRRRPMR